MLECVKRYKHLKDDVGEEQHVQSHARREVIANRALWLDQILQVVDEEFELVLDLKDLEFTQLRLISGVAVRVAFDLQPGVFRLVLLLLRTLVSVAVGAVRVAEDQPLIRRQDLGQMARLRANSLVAAV